MPLTHRLAPDDADQLVIEAVFEIDAGDEGTQALKRLLREDPVPVQSVEELKSRLAKQEVRSPRRPPATLPRLALTRRRRSACGAERPARFCTAWRWRGCRRWRRAPATA